MDVATAEHKAAAVAKGGAVSSAVVPPTTETDENGGRVGSRFQPPTHAVSLP